MADAPLLKDFIDREKVGVLAAAVGRATADFDERRFVTATFDDQWEAKALKQRIRHVASTLRSFLAGDYGEALAVLREAAGIEGLDGWMAWCLNDFVEVYGLDDPDLSLPALEQFTVLGSAEFAVRPFIARYPERMAEQMLAWARSEDEAVRRLASEGYRPRLPWGTGIPALKKDPSPVLAVLELLHDDPSETVRRSVANNLNDISKDHPGVTTSVLAGWEGETDEASALRQHALRTLLKKGDPAALDLLGFVKEADVTVDGITIDPGRVNIGGHVYFEFRVVSTGASRQPVMIDYAVVFQNRSGTGSRKVFKGARADLAPGEEFVLRRKVSLAPMSTRQIFAGVHSVEAQVNGVVHGGIEFEVFE
jgi:3-methyladenine DNA glycosylase AlkC